MTLSAWALRWGIPRDAIKDLEQQLGTYNTGATSSPLESEAGATKAIRLDMAADNALIWRNNVGACVDHTGRQIRYGLANESKGMNRSIKSSDLIGLKPVVIGQDMVGHTIGQFVAREVKKPGWYFKGTDRENAQLRFLELVISRGGDAAFTTGER